MELVVIEWEQRTFVTLHLTEVSVKKYGMVGFYIPITLSALRAS